jgi:hypothetical protein
LRQAFPGLFAEPTCRPSRGPRRKHGWPGRGRKRAWDLRVRLPGLVGGRDASPSGDVWVPTVPRVERSSRRSVSALAATGPPMATLPYLDVIGASGGGQQNRPKVTSVRGQRSRGSCPAAKRGCCSAGGTLPPLAVAMAGGVRQPCLASFASHRGRLASGPGGPAGPTRPRTSRWLMMAASPRTRPRSATGMA